MTSFVHLEYSNQHPGVARVESALVAAQKMRRGLSGARGLATLLLSAVAAAVLVVAYQVMDSVAEGHLLVVWVAMWAVAFVVLAVFAGTARQLAVRMKAGLDAWSHRMALARADDRLWAMAQNDHRVMADLQVAMARGGYASREEMDAAPAPVNSVVRKARTSGSMLHAYQRNYI